MATALRKGLIISRETLVASSHVPQVRSSAHVISSQAWRKSWRPALSLNVAGNQQSHRRRWSVAPCASTADIRFAVSSADHSESEVLIGVEDCGDGSLLFKYGALGESAGAFPEGTTEGLEAGQAQDDKMETVNWAFASNGAAGSAAEHHTQGGEPPPQDGAQNGRPASVGEGAVDPDVTLEEADVGFAAEENLVEGDICVTTTTESGEVEAKCPLSLEIGVASLPHPAKAQRGGEDAHFMEGNWLGVADGVSSWAELGINSGLYSRELMWNCLEIVRSGEVGMDPKVVIEESHGRTDLQGSCTVVVAALDGQTLRVANLGDSGFAVVRAGRMLMRSRAMQRSFNVPFQVGTSGGDDPSEAEVYFLELQARDVLLLATDGLFDNVFEDVIAGTLTQALSEGKEPEVAAKQLAQIAQKQSNQTTGSSPFSENAQAAGQQHEGGKKDDITVLVAYVS